MSYKYSLVFHLDTVHVLSSSFSWKFDMKTFYFDHAFIFRRLAWLLLYLLQCIVVRSDKFILLWLLLLLLQFFFINDKKCHFVWLQRIVKLARMVCLKYWIHANYAIIVWAVAIGTIWNWYNLVIWLETRLRLNIGFTLQGDLVVFTRSAINCAKSEPIWMKSGALSLLGLALADFGGDMCSSDSLRGRRIFVW